MKGQLDNDRSAYILPKLKLYIPSVGFHNLLYNPKPHYMGKGAGAVRSFGAVQGFNNRNRDAAASVGKGKAQKILL